MKLVDALKALKLMQLRFLTEILGEVLSPGSTAVREKLPLLAAVKTQEAVYE
jgi:hypothetical protein